MSQTEEKYLVGSQAAEFLGVKPATLYAYASRGQIESVPGNSGRERCYRLSDLIKLRQAARGVKTVRDNDQAIWTGPSIKSAITEITPEGHRYRGKLGLDLAHQEMTFEATAELLWDCEKPVVDWSGIEPFSLDPLLSQMPAGGKLECLDLLKLLLINCDMTYSLGINPAVEDVYDKARRLIVTMAWAVGLLNGRDRAVKYESASISELLARSLSHNPGNEHVRLINQALVLCADHELNASALACRIAASCDASLFSCLLSALGTFSGNLHGSASRRTEDIVSGSMAFDAVEDWLKHYLAEHESVAGFGTELYQEGDPRARLMLTSALAVNQTDASLLRLKAIVDVVQKELGLAPNLDVGLAAISYALALPPGSGSTIFAVSRTAGWIAHAMEQRLYGGVIRPRARYIGKVAQN